MAKEIVFTRKVFSNFLLPIYFTMNICLIIIIILTMASSAKELAIDILIKLRFLILRDYIIVTLIKDKGKD